MQRAKLGVGCTDQPSLIGGDFGEGVIEGK